MLSKALFVTLILCSGIAFAKAGTKFSIPSTEQHISNRIHGETLGAEPRTASSGRSLILKSILLAPIGVVLLLLAAAILFIPIPAITLPAAGRKLSAFENRAFQITKSVLASDECIERISCEVSVASRNYEYTAWVPETLRKMLRGSRWSEKITRGLVSSDSCKRFACHPSNSFKKAFQVNT